MPLRIVKPWVAPPPPWGAAYSINEGWRDACKDMGIDFVEWKTHEEDLESVCNKIQPDIIFLDCAQIWPKIPDYLAYTKCKVVVSVNQFPIKGLDPLFPSLAKDGYIANKDQIDWVESLKPDLLYHSATQSALDIGWSGWGWGRVKSIPLAGNPHIFKNVSQSHLPSVRPIDVTYIGGFSHSKQIGLFSYVFPCLDYATCYVAGPGWPLNVQEIMLSSKDCDQVWNNTKISISVQEDGVHYNGKEYLSGELSERVFNSCLSGCLVISDCPATIEEIFGTDSKYFPAFSNPYEFHEFIKDCLKNWGKTAIIEMLEGQRKAVLASHRYKNRVEMLLKYLGINNA